MFKMISPRLYNAGLHNSRLYNSRLYNSSFTKPSLFNSSFTKPSLFNLGVLSQTTFYSSIISSNTNISNPIRLSHNSSNKLNVANSLQKVSFSTLSNKPKVYINNIKNIVDGIIHTGFIGIIYITAGGIMIGWYMGVFIFVIKLFN